MVAFMGRISAVRSWGAAITVALLLAGCSGGSDGAAGGGAAVESTTQPASAAVTSAAPLTVATTIEATTTVAPTTAVPVTEPSPPSTDVAPEMIPLPPQPEGVPFPTKEWPTGELPAGLDKAALDAEVDTAFGPKDNSQIRSVVMIVGGKLVYERYHAPDTVETVFDSFSVAKSFTSAVVGIASGDGLIDVNARAERPEWADPSDPRHEITVEDLLHMSSGLEWQEGADEYGKLFAAESGAAYTASKPLAAEPGTVWNYSTGTTGILAALVADKLGGGDQLETFVRSRLLDPIGARSMVLLEDPSGVWRGGLGANATARDFARFGLLFLRDGVWDGKRILPEGWVDYSRTPSPTKAGYGKQWWLDEDGGTWFEAQGLFGQRIRVLPELDVVIVITSHPDGDSAAAMNAVQGLLTDAIG